MVNPFFSIIVVCLNPGKKFKSTLDSIAIQAYDNYEVIIKDGMSEDMAAEKYLKDLDDSRFVFHKEADTGIYDAMNQAALRATGRFIYFLNCGDLFYDENVLLNVKNEIEKKGQSGSIFYGNVFEMTTGQEVYSNPRLNRFGCYRNVPCHQAIFYRRELFNQRLFTLQYEVRADYEHFLWAALEKGYNTYYLPFMIARYEGRGFSETKVSRKLSQTEHKKITGIYMSKKEIFRYRLILLLTFAPIRSRLARNRYSAFFYNKIKAIIYRIRIQEKG